MKYLLKFFVLGILSLLLTSSCKQDDGYGLFIMDGDRILFQGDSITDGNWGKNNSAERGTDPNHIFGHGYMFICAAVYTAEYPEKKYDFYNRGNSGDKIYDLAARWKTDALDIDPDLISILIGINDVYQYLQQDGSSADNFDYRDWEDTYRLLLDQARAKNPDVKFVFGAPFVAEVGTMTALWSAREAITRKLGQIVEMLAGEYGGVFIPYFDMFEKAFERAPAEY
ncbi:MAG: GDSL-type esterase/lipase family protein [Rikenellaceae bacterium]|nr:GDSL-type esterase/lipase family protein [Rikenellaceae bacterium]